MSASTALLIDLESFYLGREQSWLARHANDPYALDADLELLLRFVEEAASGRPNVRRAYGNFNEYRIKPEAEQREYFLRRAPTMLMELGIEPVQVFRYPGGSKRSAADMRLALDAIAMLTGRAQVEHFFVAIGDADFIPLVLEMKLRGAQVSVIGVGGATKTLFQRYADDFQYFEELVAADESREAGADLVEVRDALARILTSRGPLVFAAAKPLITRELGHPFDPTRYGSETMSDFLRERQIELGIAVRPGEHDLEISLADAGGTRASNGNGPSAGAASDLARPHSANRYRSLLLRGVPKIHIAPRLDWLELSDATFTLSGGGSPVGERPEVVHGELLVAIIDRCEADGMEYAEKKAHSVLFQVFKAGCFACVAPDARGQTDFHWSRPAVLADDIRTVDDLRRKVRRWIVDLLRDRLQRDAGSDDVDLRALGELLEGGQPDDDEIDELNELVDDGVE